MNTTLLIMAAGIGSRFGTCLLYTSSMVVIACFMKIIYVGWLADKAIPDLVAKVMASAVWFCIGMLITCLLYTARCV